MAVNSRNPAMTDIHALALEHGAAYHQEKGQQVGAYIFSAERLANLLQSIAVEAVNHIGEQSYLQGCMDENRACEKICLEPVTIAGTKMIVREYSKRIAARRRAA